VILDTETTGLIQPRHHCIEVGADAFDVPLGRCSARSPFAACLSNDAEAISVFRRRVRSAGSAWRQALDLFNSLVEAADVHGAHNVPFDGQLVRAAPAGL